MARAVGVVAMGGYNTFCEILSFDKRALIVPRTAPRLEQFIRASRAAGARPGRACWPTTASATSAPMATALRQLPQQPLPSGRGRPRPARRAARTSTGWPIAGSPGRRRAAPRSPSRRSELAKARQMPLTGHRQHARSRSSPSWSRAIRACRRPSSPRSCCALERRGLRLRLVSLRHPTDRARPRHHRADRGAGRLSAGISAGASRCASGAAWRRRAAPARLRRRAPDLARATCARDPTPNRVRRFGQALVLAAELPARRSAHLHAHFLHTPASVARYAALMRGLPWSVSAHAKDIWTTPDWEKREKLRRRATGPSPARARARRISPHWRRAGTVELRLSRPRLGALSAAPAPPRPPRDGTRSGRPGRHAVGRPRGARRRATTICCAALALLPRALAWRFVHIGGGPLLTALQAAGRAQLGIADRIDWRGAPDAGRGARRLSRGRPVRAGQPHRARRRPRRPAQRADGGAEPAPAPCVATRVSAIPELIDRRRDRRAGAAGRSGGASRRRRWPR